jgi:hypothetical protein
VLATGTLPPSIVGSQSGMALAYNDVSGTFLLVGYSQLPIAAEQIRGLELNKHGAPESSVIEITSVPMTANIYAPRAAGSTDAPEWLVDAQTAADRHYVQVVTTTSMAGGSGLRLDGCYRPDPFAALGGGTCQDGGWLPPAVTPPPAAPPPATPAGPSSGCATPDPFASFGGGTCANGGWLPPGMAPPTSTSIPQEPYTPPTPPPVSANCSTPDPFVTLGGGTCANGGWLPPGIPVPSVPPPPPTTPPTTPPPAPTPPGSCSTPDPFAALGGGTCSNGGWLPPGMAVASGPPAPPPAPPSSGGVCTTPDPFASLATLVGECRNGGWVPVPRSR